jgi:hypothetical protein
MAFSRALFAFLALLGMAAGVVPALILGGRLHLGPAGAPGAGLMVAGGFLLLWCVRVFYVSGRGTIAPWDPPKRLVVGGPYRLVRNPMYIAVLGLVGGWALAFGSLALTLYLAVLAAAFHGRVVLGRNLGCAGALGKSGMCIPGRCLDGCRARHCRGPDPAAEGDFYTNTAFIRNFGPAFTVFLGGCAC